MAPLLKAPKASDVAATAAAIALAESMALLAWDYNMAKIGDYPFRMDNGVIDTIRRKRVFGFAKAQPVGTGPTYQAVGGVDDTFDVSGHFIMKSVTAFQEFVDEAAKKEPMSFVAGHGEVYGMVIVLEIDENRTQLINNGAHTKLDFTMKLAVVPEEEA